MPRATIENSDEDTVSSASERGHTCRTQAAALDAFLFVLVPTACAKLLKSLGLRGQWASHPFAVYTRLTMSMRRTSSAMWSLVALLRAHVALAQPAAPTVVALDSMITTHGAPNHLLLDAHNPRSRPVRLRVIAVEYAPPDDAPIALRQVELRVGTGGVGASSALPPRYHDTVIVYFDAEGVSPNLDRYRFRVRIELGGRPLVLLVNVTRGYRHPRRS